MDIVFFASTRHPSTVKAAWTSTMPKDVNDHGTEVEQPRRAQSVRTQEGNTRSWLKLPAPIKRVFDEFPLRTYPANELPQRTTTARDKHTLYVFATEDGARTEKPSRNPGCLKWQVCFTT